MAGHEPYRAVVLNMSLVLAERRGTQNVGLQTFRESGHPGGSAKSSALGAIPPPACNAVRLLRLLVRSLPPPTHARGIRRRAALSCNDGVTMAGVSIAFRSIQPLPPPVDRVACTLGKPDRRVQLVLRHPGLVQNFVASIRGTCSGRS